MVTRLKYEIECKVCGKKHFIRKDKIDLIDGNTCSYSCSAALKHLKHSQIGENNPNWKNGISKSTSHYTMISKKRFPEKNYIRERTYRLVKSGKIIKQPCQVCGDINVHAHHLNEVDPYNVQWLCRKHHREVHGGTH